MNKIFGINKRGRCSSYLYEDLQHVAKIDYTWQGQIYLFLLFVCAIFAVINRLYAYENHSYQSHSFTHEKGVIPHVTTIKETMIYDLCLVYHRRAGHAVSLIAAADYAPERKETYDFEVVFLKSIGRKIFQPSVLPFLPGVWRYLQQKKGDVRYGLASETFSTANRCSFRSCPS